MSRKDGRLRRILEIEMSGLPSTELIDGRTF